MSLIDAALAAPHCVLSVMGGHAGEDTHSIFERKMADVDRVGRTFWVARSPKARPPQVQDLCRLGPGYVIFVEPATAGGARPTLEAAVAEEYASDPPDWQPLPPGLGPVTGKIDSTAAGLVLDRLTVEVDAPVDLWSYADRSDPEMPLRFILGCSTLCAVRKNMATHPMRMKSRYRAAVAVGRLVAPFCVWLR